MKDRSFDAFLIQRKLERPPLPDHLVARPRLIKKLDEVKNSRATLIDAPAGYGKTTLALQWLHGSGLAPAWISIDPEDREPLRFLDAVVAGLQRYPDLELRRSKSLLAAGVSPPWQHAVDVLLAELSESGEPIVLVLEDYHFADDHRVHDIVERIVEKAPQTLHLVVLTRVDPPWPLARWRTLGWLFELRARDLCFTREETSEFFADVWDLPLSPGSVEVVQERTEGWAAGLRLVYLTLRDASDPDRTAMSLSGADSQIADYLIQEALKQQPSETADFLAKSALLDRFSAPLIKHICADTMAPRKVERMLSDLRRTNMFLVSLDSRGEWLRWHHLFRDLLRTHLGEQISTALRHRVQRDAAVWFAENGLIDEALQYYIAAGELDAAAEVVGKNLHASIEADLSRRQLAKWLEAFPANASKGRLPLLVAEAYLQTRRFDHVGLEKTLKKVEETLTDSSPRRCLKGDSELQADIDGLWSYLHYWQGDIRESLERSAECLQRAPETGTAPWMMCALYRPGALALSGRHGEAMQSLEEAMSDVGDHSPHAADLLVIAAVLNLYALDLESCGSFSRKVLELHERVGVPELFLGHAYHLIGIVAYERNRLDEAEAAFRSVESLQYSVPSRLYQDALLGRVFVAMARNDSETAKSCCSAAIDYCLEIGDHRFVHIVRSFELCAGFHSSRCAGSLEEPPRGNDHQSFWLEAPTVNWAKRLSSHPDPDERAKALAYIDDAITRMKRHHNDRQVFTLEVLRSVVIEDLGEHETALEALARLVRQGAERGIVRSFVDCGPRVKELLDDLSKRNPGDEDLESLRAAFLNAGAAGQAAHGTREPLTHRELETLKLLAWRMTNKEIATRLLVSPAAVKKRLESIYRKLDAHGRRDAIEAGIRQGLINPSPLDHEWY